MNPRGSTSHAPCTNTAYIHDQYMQTHCLKILELQNGCLLLKFVDKIRTTDPSSFPMKKIGYSKIAQFS